MGPILMLGVVVAFFFWFWARTTKKVMTQMRTTAPTAEQAEMMAIMVVPSLEAAAASCWVDGEEVESLRL
jgi:hypothetical protein